MGNLQDPNNLEKHLVGYPRKKDQDAEIMSPLVIVQAHVKCRELAKKT